MHTFKEYLLESETVDVSDFKRNIEVMADKQIFLFRGTNTLRGSFAIKPDGPNVAYVNSIRTIERKSKASSQIASKLSKDWDIPNRKLSYFVTRDADHASGFGHITLVIPSDDVDFYAWSATDFNQGTSGQFKKEVENMESRIGALLFGVARIRPGRGGEAGKIFFDVIDKTKIDFDELQPESEEAGKFVDAVLDRFDDMAAVDDEDEDNYHGVKDKVMPILTAIKKAKEKLKLKSVHDIFAQASKETYRIKTFKNLGDIPRKLKTPDELWFSGKYLAVNIRSRHMAERDAEEALKLLKDL